jgi:tetratricopeptide (TPR) repeat protein
VQLVLLQHLTEDAEGDEEEIARRVIDEANAVGDDFSISRAHQYLAEIHWDALNTEETEKALEVSLRHARAAGLKHDESKILAWLATAAFWGPRPVDEGIALCERMLSEAAGNLLVEARCLQTLAGLKAMRGEFEEARTALERAQAMQRELGQALYLATGTQFAGYIELLADDPVAAETQFRSGFDALEAMGDKSYLATSAALVARAVYAQDRYDDALRFTEISETASEGDEELKAEWGPTRARVWARQGQMEDAIHLAQASLTIASKGDDVLLRGNSLMGVAEVFLLQGRVGDALEPLREAANLYASKGIAPWRDRAAALVAQLSGSERVNPAEGP